MKTYQTILVAVELNASEDDALLRHAIDIAQDHNAKIYLLHVLEHLGCYGAAYGVAAGANIEEILIEKAKKSLFELAKKYDLPEDQCLMQRGDSATSIIDKAKEVAANLIVVGSHGRHGLALLIGSTADGVVHAAGRDVLAVKL